MAGIGATKPFALLHLTCMRLLAQCVPRHLEATALTIYGTVGIGIATALLTLACGPIFERFGAHWAMSALCAAAMPLALTLREPMAGSRSSFSLGRSSDYLDVLLADHHRPAQVNGRCRLLASDPAVATAQLQPFAGTRSHSIQG
jgi:hypothetical protein